MKENLNIIVIKSKQTKNERKKYLSALFEESWLLDELRLSLRLRKMDTLVLTAVMGMPDIPTAEYLRYSGRLNGSINDMSDNVPSCEATKDSDNFPSLKTF